MKQCDIAIIGAGTTGLAAALFLHADGHPVSIFEQFDTPKPLGAGLMLQPTGLACLAALGLDASVVENSRKIHDIDGRTTAGRRVLDIGYGELGPGIFGLGVHRATLFETLYHAVRDAGIALHTSARMESTGSDDKGRHLIDQAGKRHGPFELVIDASGARSRIREAHADIRYVRPYPYAAVWGVCRQTDDWPWPDTLTQRFRTAQNMLGVLPIGRRPGSEKNDLAFFWSLRARDYDAWRARGVREWQAEVAAYWPEAGKLAAQFTSVDDLTFATYPDVVLNRCDGDKLVFLGDAAHATSPQLGQGANLALADALELAHAIRAATVMPDALRDFARRRKNHVRFYQIASRYLTPFFQSDSRLAPLIRDWTFAPMTRIPYMRREMVRTLAGIKTGLFTSLDPGKWDPAYGIGQGARPLSPFLRGEG
ncbi:MAG: FAD-dependent oxidoreductase [Hyphomicrobiaceae bacterium]